MNLSTGVRSLNNNDNEQYNQNIDEGTTSRIQERDVLLMYETMFNKKPIPWVDFQSNFNVRKKNIKKYNKNSLHNNISKLPSRRKQRIVSKNQIITTGLDELIEVSLNITSTIKKDISTSKDSSTELGDEIDSKNDSYSSSNTDIDLNKQKLKEKEDLQNLINQIAEKNVTNNNYTANKENNIIIKNGKKMKYVKLNDNEEKNSKSFAILRGCTQMKQLKISLDIQNKLKKDGVKINQMVYNELIKICLTCNDLESASIILKEMDKNKFAADRDLLDKFVELYAKNPPNCQQAKSNVSINNTFNYNHYQYNYNAEQYNDLNICDKQAAPVINFQPQYAYPNQNNFQKPFNKAKTGKMDNNMNPEAQEFIPTNFMEYKELDQEKILTEKVDN